MDVLTCLLGIQAQFFIGHKTNRTSNGVAYSQPAVPQEVHERVKSPKVFPTAGSGHFVEQFLNRFNNLYHLFIGIWLRLNDVDLRRSETFRW